MVIQFAICPHALLLVICNIAFCQQPDDDLVPPPPPLVDKISIAELPKMSAKFRHQFTAREFTCLATVQSFPGELRSALFAFLKTSRFASPGEKFNATDVIVNQSLPGRRLIIAGISDKYAFVCYEHGGYGKHDHIILFHRTDELKFIPIANISPNRSMRPNVQLIKTIINTKNYSYSQDA
jgi:hypothetical protein